MRVIELCDLNKISLNEAALEISSLGIGLGLWDNGPQDIKEIIGLAIDLEVPEKKYKGDISADWKKLKSRINDLYEK